ncbi:12922_t:CDS:2, partial [Gigaspora margarita]
MQIKLENVFIVERAGSERFLITLTLLPQVNINYDRLLLKTWAMANIPFKVIANPYIRNLFKNLNLAYVIPYNTIWMIARWRALDEWTSKRGKSLYNYIVTTTERKEYLISLCDYSAESHTSDFMASEILNIIEQIRPKKFAAVITDLAANLRSVKEKMYRKYPHVLNLRCIAHALNLIAMDLTKLHE